MLLFCRDRVAVMQIHLGQQTRLHRATGFGPRTDHDSQVDTVPI